MDDEKLNKKLNGLTEDSNTVMLLDGVETELRSLARADAADRLLKLQQDAGTYLMGYDAKDKTAPGPGTARLQAQYTPMTEGRFDSVMRECHAALPEGGLKTDFSGLLKTLGVTHEAAILSPPRSPSVP